MLPRVSRLLSLGLILALLALGAIGASNAALANGPEPAQLEEGLVLAQDAPLALRNERVTVALELNGAPVVEAFIASKTASKAEALTAQKVRKDALAKAQATVVAAVQTAAPSARIVSQHTDLVNAVTLRVNRQDIAALAKIQGVKYISSVPDFQLDLSNSVPYIGAERVRTELGITGRGTRIAVIDTGIDYTHRDFGGPGTLEAYAAAVTDSSHVTETVTITDPTTGQTVTTKMFPTQKVVGGYDFVGETWPNNDDQVLEPDEDPIDMVGEGFDGGHGSHTAGISAGMGVPNQSFNGSIPPDASFDGTTVYHGVAPAAQIYAYKACSSVSTSCSGDAMISGFERSMDPNGDGDMSDHVDSINMSIGGPFGQSRLAAEAANNAVQAGVAVAISAGNSADVPYITGAPATADRVLSVASVQAPGAFTYFLSAEAPASIAGRRFLMAQQAWAPQLSTTGPISGELVYIGRACPAGSVPGQPGADPLLADPRGKIALAIRGSCAVSLKAATATAAGAIAVIIYNNVAGELPPDFSNGGGVVTIPAVTVNLAAGTLLRNTSGVRVTLSEAGSLSMAGFVSGFSSRGPSIVGSGLKPDVSAPGTNIVSAGAGQGNGPATMSGTSMAAPHIAGVLALVKQAHPTWTAQEVEAAVANTANPVIRDLLGINPDGTPRTTVVPISRQGAGLVDAYRAVRTTTVAYAPNQVGSVSFGFKAVVNTSTETKTFILSNKGTTTRTYNLAFAFQDPSVAPAGSTVTVTPSTVTLAAGATQAVSVTMNIVAAGLPPYGLSNAGAISGTQLTRSEISGFVQVTEQGGAGDAIAVPVYAIARRASAVDSSTNSLSLTGFGAEDAGRITLTNTSAYSGTAEIFALVGSDANEADVFDSTDVQYVGVRSGSFTSGGTTRQILEFGIKTHGARTLSMENEFDINIDVNRDGTAEYIAFNGDVGAFSTGTYTGQNATYVYNTSTQRISGPYYLTQFLVNSSNAILTFNAADLGITNDNQAFNFWVEAYANPEYEREDMDRAPDSGVYTYNARDVRFRVSDPDGSVVVAPNSSLNLDVYANARGFLGGDTTGRFPERGMLILYTENAPPTRDADIVNVSFPFNFRVEQQTLTFNPTLSGYIVNRPGDLAVQFNVGDLWTGVDNRPLRPLVYNGIVQFNLGTAGSTVEFEEAVLELTGLDATYMNPNLEGRWGVDMLTSAVDTTLGRATYGALANATADARLTPLLTDADLAPGRTNTFMFDAAARAKLTEHVRSSGRVTFRTFEDPVYTQGMQLFAWDGRGGTGADIRPPVLRVLTVTRLP